jgi:uncharacterized protein (TIGR02145 family)
VKKSIRVVVFLFVIVMLPGWFQGFNQVSGNVERFQLLPIALAETITVSDLGIYDAAGKNFHFDFPRAGSMKFVSIVNFSAGDTIQLQEGNEINIINPWEGDLEIIFGSIGGPDGAWFGTFSGLETQLVADVSEANSLEDRLEVLKTHWGSDFILSEYPPCKQSILPTSGTFSSSGGSRSVSVTASNSDCDWTTSNPLPWVTVSPITGMGDKSVIVSVAANTDTARSGSITIAGQTYLISQAGTSGQTSIFLTRTSPDHTITSGSDIQVFGTSTSNQITLESGAKAELINFPGFNTVQIQSSSDAFQVSRSGTVVIFEGTDGTVLKIPATTSVQTVSFSDRAPLSLSIYNSLVRLDDQIIGIEQTSIKNNNGTTILYGSKMIQPEIEDELSLADGTMIKFPAGALSNEQEISVELHKTTGIGDNYNATMFLMPEGLRFDSPITISFPFPDDLNENVQLEAILFSEEAEAELTDFEYAKFISPDMIVSDDRIQLEIEHFSILNISGIQPFYAVFAPASNETLNRYLKMGDIEYNMSTMAGKTGWVPGHARVYLGFDIHADSYPGGVHTPLNDTEKEVIKAQIDNLSENDSDKFMSGTIIHSWSDSPVIFWKPGVTINKTEDYGHRDTRFSNTYLGAKRRKNVSWQDRIDVAKFLIDKEGSLYHWVGNNHVDGYSCVGLVESAYERIGKNIVWDIPWMNAVIPARQIISPELEDIDTITVPEGETVTFDVYGVLTDEGVFAPADLKADPRAIGRFDYNFSTHHFTFITENISSPIPYEFDFKFVYHSVNRFGTIKQFTENRTLKVYVEPGDSNYPTLELAKNLITLQSGESAVVGISGGTGHYTSAYSSDADVANVTFGNNNTINILGVSQGSATVTVEDSSGNRATIDVTVISAVTPSGDCGAHIAPGVWKKFDCYNLAAIGKTTNDDPFTPSWRLIGGYWQWGRKGPENLNTNTPNFAHGPTGESISQANSDAIPGWSDISADDDAWRDSNGKTVDDPCPDGFRLPTIDEWNGVLATNEKEFVGDSWTEFGATNYDTGLKLGDALFLPATGNRDVDSGALGFRGGFGFYWSSSESTTVFAGALTLARGLASTHNYGRSHGFSVRCISEK